MKFFRKFLKDHFVPKEVAWILNDSSKKWEAKCLIKDIKKLKVRADYILKSSDISKFPYQNYEAYDKGIELPDFK